MKGYTLNFGNEILSGAFPFAYAEWATLYGLGAWAATDSLGIHNVFRYLFDVPTGAITNPPARARAPVGRAPSPCHPARGAPVGECLSTGETPVVPVVRASSRCGAGRR